jgi:hypothetical protein
MYLRIGRRRIVRETNENFTRSDTLVRKLLRNIVEGVVGIVVEERLVLF